jgi:hypothetical protein
MVLQSLQMKSTMVLPGPASVSITSLTDLGLLLHR